MKLKHLHCFFFSHLSYPLAKLVYPLAYLVLAICLRCYGAKAALPIAILAKSLMDFYIGDPPPRTFFLSPGR
jgi:uncharacterized PurR-regulated membrane protein YhhQ (DUF165 family)